MPYTPWKALGPTEGPESCDPRPSSSPSAAWGAGQGCPEAEHPPWAGPGLALGRHGGRGQRPQAGGRRPHPHLVPGPELRQRHPVAPGRPGPWPGAQHARFPWERLVGASPAARATPRTQGNGVSKCRPELSHPSPHHDQRTPWATWVRIWTQQGANGGGRDKGAAPPGSPPLQL